MQRDDISLQLEKQQRVVHTQCLSACTEFKRFVAVSRAGDRTTIRLCPYEGPQSPL